MPPDTSGYRATWTPDFSHRIAQPENLEVAYRDADGAARLMYFDRLFISQDRDDIAALARHGLIDAGSLRQRA